jgi:DsbC/DsbD-like thiol-disulfide interchange protein
MSPASGGLLLKIDIEIPDGWHINAHQPGSKDFIATRLSLSERARGWHLGPVDYPRGEDRQLAFQPQPLIVYSDKVRLQAIVSSDKRTALTLPLDIRLQACNDQACLPPETVTLSLVYPTIMR